MAMRRSLAHRADAFVEPARDHVVAR
jgi:hypothetical protein